MQSCFTSGSTSVTNENGGTVNNDGEKGCLGFQEGPDRTLCVSNCVQICSESTSSGGGAEPFWEATDKKEDGRNFGVTIRPGSEIIIKAIGSINLGEAKQIDAFIDAIKYSPHSRSVDNANNTFIDVVGGKTLSLQFSGKWQDGATSQKYSTTGTNTAEVINGARRAVAYLIPHPNGYDFSSSATDEKSGSKGVPLLPDMAAWQCAYSGTDPKQSNCSNKPTGYTSNGYIAVNDTLAASAFPISSAIPPTNSTLTFGGMIRWDGDGVSSGNDDPFIGVSFNGNGDLSSGTLPAANKGRMVGVEAGNNEGVNIANPYSDAAVKVSFKSLSGTNCTMAAIDKKFVVNGSAKDVNANWLGDSFFLEPGLSLSVKVTKLTITGHNCGKAIAARFDKLHEIKIGQSGFVRFAMLGNTGASGSCTINARILNPAPADVADRYEYEDFSTSLVDPLRSLLVGVYSSSTSPATIFLRKGQVIRFAPDSWNGIWTAAAGLSRQCGIGMAMIVEPRPALLCKGQRPEYVDNSDCVQDYEGSTLIGCKPRGDECLQEDNNYCPTVGCQQTVTCSTDGMADDFKKEDCSLSGEPSQGSAICPTHTFPETRGTCNACSGAKLLASEKSAKISVSNVDQCYDLENYTGRVSDIPLSPDTNFTGKGAVKLGSFNGSYGNFSSFSPVTDDNGAVVMDGTYNLLQARSPPTFFRSGRLRFLMLDGTDFNNTPTTDINGAVSAYTDNTNGERGFKIHLNGQLEFRNGQWLQARICPANDAGVSGGDTCITTNPSKLAGTPTIIDINAPTDGGSSPPNITSDYKFDSYGKLERTAVSDSEDCKLDTHGIATAPGSKFYCHIYEYHAPGYEYQDTADAKIKKIKLTFKILDPEKPNCVILTGATSTSGDGVKTKNAHYDSLTSSNTGATCTAEEASSNPPSCKKQFICANKYANNSGKYYVSVKVKTNDKAIGPIKLPNFNVSSIVGGVIAPIIETMDGPKKVCNASGDATGKLDGIKNSSGACVVAPTGQAERIYKLLIADPKYQAILNMCLVVMFTFYGMGYLMGVSELKHSEIVNRVVKIGVIYLFVGEQGWDWFNSIVVRFFKEGTDYLAFMMASSFDSSQELADAIANVDFYDKSILFSSVDKVFSMFFSTAVQKKIYALLFASIFGWAYLLIIYCSFMLYVYAVANAVLLYLTAQVFMSILFTLGPIFLIFILFGHTKDMFDNWLKSIIGFSLQQIFLLTTLSFFNMLMYEVIKMSLGYKICWGDVWVINIVTPITLLQSWKIASLPSSSETGVGNIGNPEGIPSLFSILFIWVIASLMGKFISFMTDLAASMSGGLQASALGKGLQDAAKDMQKRAGAYYDKAWDKLGGAKRMKELDRDLFDHGALADKERVARRRVNKADSVKRAILAKSGDKAMSDYKKDNAVALAGMSKDEQRKKLSEVKNAAMDAKGKDLGLSTDQIKALKEGKGFKSEAQTLGGAAFDALKQSASRGGALKKSLNEEKVSTKFSSGEAASVMKKMTSAEREKFVESAAKGDVKVGRSAAQNVASSAASAGKAVKESATAAIASGALKEFQEAKGMGGKALAAGKALAIIPGVALVATAEAASGLAVSAAKSVDEVARNKVARNKAYDEAAKQLEKTGEISKMQFGTGWARDGKEKDLIRAKVKENAKESKARVKQADTRVVAGLKAITEEQNKIDKVNESGAGMMSRLGDRTAATLDRVKAELAPSESVISNTAKDVDDKTQSRIKEDLGKAQAAEEALKKNRVTVAESVKENKKALDDYDAKPVKDKDAAVSKAQGEYEEAVKRNAPAADVKKLRGNLEEAKKQDATRQGLKDEYDKNTVGLHRHDDAIKNVGEKIAKLKAKEGGSKLPSDDVSTTLPFAAPAPAPAPVKEVQNAKAPKEISSARHDNDAFVGKKGGVRGSGGVPQHLKDKKSERSSSTGSTESTPTSDAAMSKQESLTPSPETNGSDMREIEERGRRIEKSEQEKAAQGNKEVPKEQNDQEQNDPQENAE